jgi:hypothetical protein
MDSAGNQQTTQRGRSTEIASLCTIDPEGNDQRSYKDVEGRLRENGR